MKFRSKTVGGSSGQTRPARQASGRFVLAALAAVAFAIATVSMALADVDQNPTVFVATNLSCANGFESEELLIVGRTGHTEDGFGGVAKAVWILNLAPEPIEVFSTPGRGLDGLTVWCEWDGGPLRFGGDILFPGNAR